MKRIVALLNEKGPIAVLKKAEVLAGRSLDELEAEVLRFFELKSLDEEQRLAAAAKRSNHGEPLSSLQTSWLYMVRHAGKRRLRRGRIRARRLKRSEPHCPE